MSYCQIGVIEVMFIFFLDGIAVESKESEVYDKESEVVRQQWH